MKIVFKTDKEWRQELSDVEFDICRKKGTERAFSGKYNACYNKGFYVCIPDSH